MVTLSEEEYCHGTRIIALQVDTSQYVTLSRLSSEIPDLDALCSATVKCAASAARLRQWANMPESTRGLVGGTAPENTTHDLIKAFSISDPLAQIIGEELSR